MRCDGFGQASRVNRPALTKRTGTKEYRVRAVHRDIPDVQRLTELVIRLAIQRREIDRVARGDANLSPHASGGYD